MNLGRLFTISFVVVTILSSGFSFSESNAAENEISHDVLKNGLQVVVIPDHRAPVVTHMVWYKAGSADEPIGKSGIAHFLEHLMFKGTTNKPEGEFSAKIAEIGGQENAFTSTDYTAYYQKIPSSALATMMEFESDRMANLAMKSSHIVTERDVVQEERRQRFGNNPGGKLNRAMMSVMYRHHPYGIPVIGWESELRNLSIEDAQAFYDKFYTPNNATLVVAGDVTREQVLELAKNTYGKIERRAEPGKRLRVIEPEPLSSITVTHRDAQVTTPSWSRNYQAVSYNNDKGNEAEALDLLGTILGGSSTSRINSRLVKGREIATSAGAYYSGTALDNGVFGFYATPRGDTSLEVLEKAVEEIISEVLQSGVTQEELDRAKNAIIKTTIYSRDSQTFMARIYGTVLTLDGTIADVLQWPDRIAAVTVEDVNAAARTYLKEQRSVTGYLLPEVTN